MNQVPTSVGHTGAAVSIGSWLVTVAAHGEPIVAFLCGIVGIISGAFAIAVHWRRLRDRK